MPRDDREPFRSDWDLEHSPYTFEGQIEGLGNFARGVGRSRGRRRVAAKVVAWLLLLSFAFPALLWLLATLVGDLLG